MALKDYAPNPAVIPVDGIGKHFIVKSRIDFSAVPLGASDTAKLLEIKAGWDVKKVWTKIVTPEAAADTFGLGDSGGATGWDAAVPANAAAGTVASSTEGTDANATPGGKFYPADDYLLLTPSAELAQLVLDVAIEVVVPF
jgi:hypothetical protein